MKKITLVLIFIVALFVGQVQAANEGIPLRGSTGISFDPRVPNENKLALMLYRANKKHVAYHYRYYPQVMFRHYEDCTYYKYCDCKDIRFSRCWQCKDYVYPYIITDY